MSRHFDNKRVWSREGVSEIIGTILILAITVVLFSGVIVMVGNMPTPTSNVNSSLQGSIEAVNDDWTQGAWVNISNRGGVVLKGAWTDIIIIIHDTSSHHRTTSATPGLGIDGDGDEDWETGETWRYKIPAGAMDNSTLVSVMIIAEDRSAIIWTADLRPAGARNYPPVIMGVWVTSLLTDIEVQYIQYGEDYTVHARIIDFDDNMDYSSVWVNLTSFGLPPMQLTYIDSIGEFQGTAAAPYDEAVYPRGQHPVTVNATDTDGAYTEKTIYPSIGGIFTGASMLSVVSDDVTFSDDILVHNKKVDITALVNNFGVGGICTVNFYDNGAINVTNLIKVVGGVGVPSNGFSDVIVSWTPTYGGLHALIVEVVPTPPTFDDDLSNNVAFVNVTVMPTILLVDDDGHSNDRTDADTSSFMRAALSAGNFEYDFVSVAVGDGPQYDKGDYKMVNYDVVIWMTGYTTTSTLTSNDVANLKKFLGVGTNAGSLWLIGQGVLAEAATVPTLNSFLLTNMSIDNGWINRDPMAVNLTTPTPADPVTGYLSGGSFEIVQRNTLPVNGYAISDSASPSSFRSLVDGATGADCYGVGFSVDSIESRTYFTPWEFSRIKDSSDQAQLAYQVIRWLGDINSSFGRDLAISEQSINKDVVYFRQQIEISGIVRNNGMQNENSTVKMYVYYNGVPLTLNTTTDIPVYVPNTVGSNWMSVGPFYWYPEYIGFHSIVLMVDPNNDIPESNEDNNVVSNYLASGTINVQFRLLVVDDDESLNNGGGLSNETATVRSVCQNLGYFKESYVVNATEPGPSYSYLQDFNAVIWSTGNANGAFRPEDVANLTSYVNNGGNLWVLGRSALALSPTVEEQAFQRDILGVALATTQANPSTLLGVDDNAISHGISYRMSGGLCQQLTPMAGVNGAYHITGTTYNGLSNDLNGPKTVTTAFSLSDLNGSAEFPGDLNARTELAYLVLHWFNLPDYRVELRTTGPDFHLLPAGVKPQLGDSYVLQAKVHNVGGADGNALVRFMDGTTQIGSDSISVSANGYTTAEVIWTPLFAGYRTLRVLVDPLNETGEIIEWFNNQISHSTYVYFFYDDMESGTAKWQHESTIALINGEQPLDYISGTAVSMNITKAWDSSFSNNLTTCTDTGFYHTFNTSYWMQEPAGGTGTTKRIPMDVGIIIDTSGSMDSPKIDNAKQAAKDFIAKLTSEDRCTLWRFTTGEAALQSRTFAYMDQATRDSFNTTITPWVDDGYTPIWDTIGETLTYMFANPRLTGVAGTDYLQVLIALTDGDDYGTDGTEDGSETYCPGSDPGTSYLTATWGRNGGLDWGDPAATFQNQDGTGGHDIRRYNGGYYWADLADHTRTGLLRAPAVVYTVGLGINPHSATGADTWYPFTTEHDLWKIANTSEQMGITGQYFYESDSSNLTNIFQFIFEQIGTQLGGENITRTDDVQPMSAPPSAGTRGGGEGINSLPPQPGVTATTVYNYVGVTRATNDHYAWFYDVDDATNAQLTNGNGGLTVEFTDAQYLAASVANELPAPIRAISTPMGNQDEVFFKSYFQIAETPADITQIDFYFDGQIDVASTYRLYAWNRAANTWTALGGGTTAAAADTDVVITQTINLNCANYITATGQLIWGAYSAASNTLIRVDYAEVTITYTARSRATITGIAPISPSNVASPTFTYNIQPLPSPAPTSVDFYYSTDVGTSWILWGTDLTPDGSWSASVDLPADGTYHFTARGISATSEPAPSGAASIEPQPAMGWILDRVPPAVTVTQPANGAVNVPTAQNVEVTFSEPMDLTVQPTIQDASGIVYTPAGWISATTFRWTHAVAWAYDTDYTLNVTGARDVAGNYNNSVYAWTFHTARSGTATATGTVNVVPSAVANPTITYTYEGVPTSVDIYYTYDSGLTWTLWGTDASVDGTWTPGTNLLVAGAYGWIAVAVGGGSTEVAPASTNSPEAQTYYFDNGAPFVQGVTPSSGATNVARGALVKVRFNERMRTSVTPTISGGGATYSFSAWTTTALQDDTAVWTHTDWPANTIVSMSVSLGQDYAGNVMIPFSSWSFTTGSETGQGSGGGTGLSPAGPNSNKSAVTESMDLTDLERATLSFWHKYNIVPGANGGVLLVGYMEQDLNPDVPANWKWRYVVPSSAYTGNLRLNVTSRTDDFGAFIQWGWNGVSGRGTFTWEKVGVDLLDWVYLANGQVTNGTYDIRSNVRVKFQYYQYGGGTGYGWYIDDVKVAVTRADETAVNAASADAWQLVNRTWASPFGTHSAHSGDWAWWNGNVTTGMMKKGVDNSLICGPIDLTNARNATLGAYFKFNLNTRDGAPPDGFRVEISKDNGLSWFAINLGVRAAWNVSGVEPDASDGKVDVKSYSGINSGNYWVSAGTLTRLNVDLSAFTGNAIMLRFRVVTNANPLYLAYKSNTVGFGGFYVDDVTVMGNTILG